jgi:hypothetical protein
MSDHQRATANSGPGAAVLKGPAALIIGHPGHELRIHHWLEIARPLTFVLTDGSGRGEQSRLSWTENVLHAAGGKPASVFGRWTDAQAYEILLSGNLAALSEVTSELADALAANNIQAVVADAMEGINPTHDLCRYIANIAVLVARRGIQREMATYDFDLGAPPPRTSSHNGSVRIDLDSEALDRKWRAAGNYPALRREVLIAKVLYGRARFAIEILRPVTPRLSPGFSGEPRYEANGKKRVREGRYNKVIRYREHVLPLMKALWQEFELPAIVE